MRILLLNLAVFTALFSFDTSYKVPPTSQTSTYVPVISDSLMKECVKIYNEAVNLEKELNSSYVNQYSSQEVNLYNQKIRIHSNMIDWFNANCADRQSYSACKAANELNREKGLALQNCGD